MNIRHFIDLIEQRLTEDFNDSSALQSEIARCKAFRSADAYAHSDYNPIHLTHADDDEDSIPRRLWNKAAFRMKSRWHTLNNQGLLDDPKPRSRFGR